MEFFGAFYADFSIILLSLELQFNIKNSNLGVGEFLCLLLKTSIGECFLEANTLHEERLGNRASGNFLNTNVRLVKVLIQEKDGFDDELGEELLELGDNFGVQRSLGALNEKVSFLILGFVTNFDGDLLDSFVAFLRGISETLDDDLRMHAFIDKRFSLFK